MFAESEGSTHYTPLKEVMGEQHRWVSAQRTRWFAAGSAYEHINLTLTTFDPSPPIGTRITDFFLNRSESFENEKRAEQKRIEDDKRAEQQRIEDEKLAEQQRIENEKRDEKIRLRKRDLDNLYATLVTSPTPPYPRCERHAKLAETPIGCDRCAVARRAWMDVARRVAHETFTIGNVHNTDAAKKLREAWWDDWAKGNDESMARLAEMRSKEVL